MDEMTNILSKLDGDTRKLKHDAINKIIPIVKSSLTTPELLYLLSERDDAWSTECVQCLDDAGIMADF